MPMISSIHGFLRQGLVPYTVVPNGPAVFSAREESSVTPNRGRDRAKITICLVDGEPVEAVHPAPLVVNLDRLRELAGGREIRLAHRVIRQSASGMRRPK